jgi:TonB-dependent receptor
MNTTPLSHLQPRTWRRAFLVLLGLVWISSAFAQESGSLAGRVTDIASGTPLSGAIVRIDSLALETSSDRLGEFIFTSVPAGSHVVNVSYLGIPAKDFNVAVTAGDRATLLAKLGDDAIKLETFTVNSQRAGQARALNEQRASGNLRTIVSSDALGRFPDQNAAETMQRITGVSLERDQGEGRFISIRGVDPDLNNTQLNGVNIPASQEDSRKVNLDVFPSDILDSIEVVKAVTPDMDGDAIGGSVNIKTQTAFSSDGRILRGSAETGYSDLAEKWSYKLGAVWGEKFKSDTIGFLVAFSTAKREFASDGRETDDNPWVTKNGFIIPGADVQHREYTISRWRKGASFSLDFKPSADNSYFVRGVYSHFSDYENRFRTRFRGTPGTTTPTSNTTGTVSGSRIVVDLKDRYEDNNVWSLSAGGENLRGNWTIDYLAAYAHSELVDPFRVQPAFRTGNTSWNYDFSDPQNPIFTGTGVNLPASSFSYNSWALDKGMNDETEYTFAINFKRDLRFGQHDGHLKFGAKYRMKERTVDITSDSVILASGSLTLADFVRTSERGVTPTFPSINPKAFRAFYQANPGRFTLNVEDSRINASLEDYESEENILAAYAMADATFNKLTVIGGVRAEQTDYQNQAYNVNLDVTPALITRTSASRDYTTVLPGVVTRYDFSKRVIGRASWTTTLARPKPLDASSSRSVEDGDVSLGNPNLRPYKSNNFDASFEFYPKSLGVISVGAFHKDIKDFIYSQVTVDAGGSATSMPLNGDSATVSGLEADWQQQLTFLPSPFDGIGFYANATLTDTESVLDGGRKVPFLNQSKKIYNLALSYEKYGFFIRASLNYRSKYLSLIGPSIPALGEGSGDQYIEDHTQIDLSMNYKLTRRYTIYAEIMNLTDEPYSAVYNVSGGLRKAEFYSWSANIGVKFNF